MKCKDRLITCLWLFPLMFSMVILGFSWIFFPAIFILMAYEIIRWKPVSLIAILHICGILSAIFLAKGEVSFLLAVIFSNDCAAMLSGKFLGGRLFSKKPVPKISPHKTFEGYIGGFMGALIAGIIMGKVGYKITIAEIFFATLFLAACGNTGDLLASAVKRTYDLKDSGEGSITGKIFAGHGGAYDRFDSTSLAVPFWLAWNIGNILLLAIPVLATAVVFYLNFFHVKCVDETQKSYNQSGLV